MCTLSLCGEIFPLCSRSNLCGLPAYHRGTENTEFLNWIRQAGGTFIKRFGIPRFEFELRNNIRFSSNPQSAIRHPQFTTLRTRHVTPIVVAAPPRYALCSIFAPHWRWAKKISPHTPPDHVIDQQEDYCAYQRRYESDRPQPMGMPGGPPKQSSLCPLFRPIVGQDTVRE